MNWIEISFNHIALSSVFGGFMLAMLWMALCAIPFLLFLIADGVSCCFHELQSIRIRVDDYLNRRLQ